MKYSTLPVRNSKRDVIDVFKGYNHNLRIGDGEFFNMKNMTSDHYPVLSPRKNRHETTFVDLDGSFTVRGNIQGLLSLDYMLWFTRGESLMASGHAYELGLSPGTSDDPKQLISMGSYIIVMPDKKYINTNDPTHDYGDIEAFYKSTGDVRFELCSLTGESYENPTVSNEAPDNPGNMDVWIDTSSKPHTLKKYSSASGMWISIATTYVKISAANIGTQFDQYDGVTISGIKADGATDLNGSAVIWDRGDDYIVVVGILDSVVTQAADTGTVCVTREMPKMDYIFESGNRLWGCRYGYTNGNTAMVNEIYASKLGDFKNWSCYMGLSTDSYTASCGTDGPFTGAIAYQGYPLFFKENCIHKVYGNYPANYQIQVTECQGVQKQCHKSLTVVNGTLFYKSNRAVCAYDGALPVEVSYALGSEKYPYAQAVGGTIDNKYYLSMKDEHSNWNLLVYDVEKNMWHKEDNFHAESFCTMNDQLHGIDAENGRIVSMLGKANSIPTYSPYSTKNAHQAYLEGPVEWMVESGEIGISSPDMKYLSRITLRMSLDLGSKVRFYAQYDSSGDWEPVGAVSATSMRSFSIPIRPKRCDHLRLRIEGIGDAKIYSLTKTIEQGSDLS